MTVFYFPGLSPSSNPGLQLADAFSVIRLLLALSASSDSCLRFQRHPTPACAFSVIRLLLAAFSVRAFEPLAVLHCVHGGFHQLRDRSASPDVASKFQSPCVRRKHIQASAADIRIDPTNVSVPASRSDPRVNGN